MDFVFTEQMQGVVTVTPVTDAALSWMQHHHDTSEGPLIMSRGGRSFHVERKHADVLFAAITRDGLTVAPVTH